MLGKSADVTRAGKKKSNRDNDSVDLQTLRTLQRLLAAAITTTRLLGVRDEESKRELLDIFVLAEISLLRLLADEGELDT